MVVEDRIRLIGLYDIYGALLTERQQRIFQLHYTDDLSFGEIAEELTVSRPAVADHLNRACTFLLDCERKLGLSAKLTAVKINASEAIEILSASDGSESPKTAENRRQAIELLKALLDSLIN